MLTEEVKKELIKKCLDMRAMAYIPYSNFEVGAALLTSSGKIYGGCNVENAAYGPCNCGERTAAFKAVSEGDRKFIAIAITGNKRGSQPSGTDLDFAFPCGVCRQVLREFSNPKEMKVFIVASETRVKEFTLEQLLPNSFGPENLLSP